MFQDVLNALNDGSFRIGLHMISYASGGSESFINNRPTPPVPAPGALLLATMGLAMVRFYRGRTA